MLFGCSVRENIAYGLENVTDEEVERVAKMANAHDFIVDSKDGYKTSVGEKGAQISGINSFLHLFAANIDNTVRIV